MATTFQHVNPGDLISSNFMNDLVDEINSLETRLEALETPIGSPPDQGAGPPILTTRSPTGDVEIGSLLTVTGQNFTPLEFTRVNLGAAQISSFEPGASSTQLSFPVPSTLSAPATVTVSISTPQGTSATLPVHLVPAAAPAQGGQAFIDNKSTPPGQINPGQPYTFQWDVRSGTLLPASYTFSVVWSDVTPSTELGAWQAATGLSSSQQLIAPGSPFRVTATVTVPPGAGNTDTATLVLHVASADGAFVRTSDPIVLTVGSSAPVSDPRIQITYQTPGPGNDAGTGPNPVGMHLDATGKPIYTVKFGQSGSIPVQVIVTEPGVHNYQFQSQIEQSGTAWSAGSISPVGPAPLQPSEGPLDVYYGIANLDSSGGGSTDDAFIVVKVVRVGDATPAYTSFARYHIQGTN